jgi:hypothetical protein
MNMKKIKKVTLSMAILAAGLIALISGFVTATASAQVRTSVVRANLVARMASTTRFASTTRMSSTTRQAMLENRQNEAISLINGKSVQEITSRVVSLNALSTRLSSMKNLSASESSTLSNEITTLIGELTGLQAKIQADASSTSIGTAGALASTSPLRQDFTSITKVYRVYALVIPQTQILAAADRVNTIVISLTTLSTKLQSRLSSVQSNFASLQADLTDLNTQTTNAQTQAAAAVTAVSSLVPDNGNATVAVSNEAALKSGRANIVAAQKDIQAADKDAHTIVVALEGMHAGTGVGTTASGTVSSQ